MIDIWSLATDIFADFKWKNIFFDNYGGWERAHLN